MAMSEDFRGRLSSVSTRRWSGSSLASPSRRRSSEFGDLGGKHLLRRHSQAIADVEFDTDEEEGDSQVGGRISWVGGSHASAYVPLVTEDPDSAGSMAESLLWTPWTLLSERPLYDDVLQGVSRYLVDSRRCCRTAVESTPMVCLTVLVTIFALVSTDLRDILTNKPADIYFDFAILTSMAIFTLEFILSCFGKEDYVCGFFFMLDIISTVSMALDMSFFEYYVLDSDANLSNARAGQRTARLGARAARMVRVIRLFRLVKLYKAILARTSIFTAKENEGRTLKNVDDMSQYQMEDIEALDQMSSKSESRIGAKLSELTTRRVITVVMMLLLFLPSLQLDCSQLSPASMQFGADVVWRAFLAMREGNGTREKYDFALLDYMFYHNWFTRPRYCRSGKQCSGKFFSHLFWVGIEGNDTNAVFQNSRLAAMTSASVGAFHKQFADQNDLYNYGMMPTEVMVMLGESWNMKCDDSIWSRVGMSLLQHEIEGDSDYVVACPQDLRPREKVAYHPVMITSDHVSNYHIVFYFDLRLYVRMEAMLSLAECVFVCIMFCFASMALSNDVNTLVLAPIERMVQLLKLIGNDPRIASKITSDEMKNELVDQSIESQLEKKGWGRYVRCMQNIASCQVCGKNEEQSSMETVILEKTIMRLASMLTLGLGEAGLEIIHHSLSHSASSWNIDVFALPCSAVDCVMAVVQTQDFNCAIEVLQEKIVKFVSLIVEIVHGVIYEYQGAPNRNNGDSLLLIWRKFDDDDEASLQKLCEMALLSCVKIYAAVQKSTRLQEFSRHPGFQQRLGSNYHVSLTFGLHMGWAIEGAVGSEMKIDATYFSPNVNIAFAIERATGLYKVPILATGSVVEAFSDGMFEECRLIDRVLIQGSVEPLNLYCLDLDTNALKAEQVEVCFQWNARTRFKVRQWMETQRDAMIDDDTPILSFFHEDEDIQKLRARYTEKFVNVFRNAYQCYALGEWEAAASRLKRTLTVLGTEDGPSRSLLDFMQSPYDFKAPKNWHGVRKLDLSGGIRTRERISNGEALPSEPRTESEPRAEGFRPGAPCWGGLSKICGRIGGQSG